MIKFIGQQARQEWQKINRKSWSNSGKYKDQKLRRLKK